MPRRECSARILLIFLIFHSSPVMSQATECVPGYTGGDIALAVFLTIVIIALLQAAALYGWRYYNSKMSANRRGIRNPFPDTSGTGTTSARIRHLYIWTLYWEEIKLENQDPKFRTLTGNRTQYLQISALGFISALRILSTVTPRRWPFTRLSVERLWLETERLASTRPNTCHSDELLWRHSDRN
ncbi:unnamed protein product [Nesidiocoris tenuis]|uniref:Uncharacterized protein n=1 Tax=Nesidiocoris tenuis TaxID=355587 RepID=A0A6H5GVA3_9HEMI|nr:unnamed protein product [Nesidiocoris tenuis]